MAEAERYVIADANNHYYIMAEGGPQITTSKLRATRYSTLEKANNVINSSISPTKRVGCKVIDLTGNVTPVVKPVVTKQTVVKPAAIQTKPVMPSAINGHHLCRKTVKDDLILTQLARGDQGEEIEDFPLEVAGLSQIVKSLINRKENLVTRLATLDQELSDIHHHMEFTNYNAYQGYLVCKSIQNRLRSRRKVKNELAQINSILDSKFSNVSPEKIEELINPKEEVVYRPRQLDELFEE